MSVVTLVARVVVAVVGPQRIEAGAANELRIETNNLNQDPVPTRLQARVMDQASRKVVFEEKDIASNGKYRLVLPPTLHAAEPSPHVDWSAGAVRLLTREQDWPSAGRPRLSGRKTSPASSVAPFRRSLRTVTFVSFGLTLDCGVCF